LPRAYSAGLFFFRHSVTGGNAIKFTDSGEYRSKAPRPTGRSPSRCMIPAPVFPTPIRPSYSRSFSRRTIRSRARRVAPGWGSRSRRMLWKTKEFGPAFCKATFPSSSPTSSARQCGQKYAAANHKLRCGADLKTGQRGLLFLDKAPASMKAPDLGCRGFCGQLSAHFMRGCRRAPLVLHPTPIDSGSLCKIAHST
jgi:hypothetical protein